MRKEGKVQSEVKWEINDKIFNSSWNLWAKFGVKLWRDKIEKLKFVKVDFFLSFSPNFGENFKMESSLEMLFGLPLHILLFKVLNY
jgi:hypothetical protein